MTAPAPTCRLCGAPLDHTFIDLGMSPLCESYVAAEALDRMEPFYPLHVRVCDRCWLVQLPAHVGADAIFSDYAYFASYSDSWVQHAARFVEAAVTRYGLGAASSVVEVASNDGYLLQHVVRAGIPCWGVEPAANVAEAARARGVPTEACFLGLETARTLAASRGRADLLVANNVIGHVPDLRDFTAGLAELLAPGGVLTVEIPHLLRLVEGNQFDTIYHEHYQYFSCGTMQHTLAEAGLRLFDVERLATHGGSLRYHACHEGPGARAATTAVAEVLAEEAAAGVHTLAFPEAFRQRVEATRHALLEFLIDARRRGERVAGYGAPGKSATLLNYCGVRTDLLPFTVDRSPHKQGRFTPGTHIPILAPEQLDAYAPDYVLLLAWNLADEIARQLAPLAGRGTRLVVPIPDVTVLPTAPAPLAGGPAR